MEFLRADDEIDVRHRAEKFRAARLRHAAEKTEDRFRPLLRDLAEHAHFAERLLVRHVAHAAGVEQDDVGFVLVRRGLVAAIEQRTRDLFRVALVHLAAVGLDEKFRHLRAATYTKALARRYRRLAQLFVRRSGEAIRETGSRGAAFAPRDRSSG